MPSDRAEVGRYRKRPVVIEAVQLTEANGMEAGVKVHFWSPETNESVTADMEAVPRHGEWVFLGSFTGKVKAVSWYPLRVDEDSEPVDYDVEVVVDAH